MKTLLKQPLLSALMSLTLLTGVVGTLEADQRDSAKNDTVVAEDNLSSNKQMPMRAKLFAQSAESFKLALENNSEDVVRILVLDQQNNEVYSQTLHNTNQHLGTYDVSNLREGKYLLEIQNGKRRIAYNLQVQ